VGAERENHRRKKVFKKENTVYIIGSIIRIALRVTIGIDSIGSLKNKWLYST